MLVNIKNPPLILVNKPVPEITPLTVRSSPVAMSKVVLPLNVMLPPQLLVASFKVPPLIAKFSEATATFTRSRVAPLAIVVEPDAEPSALA